MTKEEFEAALEVEGQPVEIGDSVACAVLPTKSAEIIDSVPERGTIIIAYDHTAGDGTQFQTFGEYPTENLIRPA